jgi:hypothetical protein
MSDRLLAAVFFIAKKEEQFTIEELLDFAQAKDVYTSPPSEFKPWNSVHCEWAGLIDCWAYLHELPYHQLLIIYFRQSGLLRLLPPEDSLVPLEDDPTMQIALTFKVACETLLPEVAFIPTHLYDSELKWILDREWMVLAMDATALADERFGLLYLNEEISLNWIHHPLRDDRDSLSINNGLLVFASRGSLRWF